MSMISRCKPVSRNKVSPSKKSPPAEMKSPAGGSIPVQIRPRRLLGRIVYFAAPAPRWSRSVETEINGALPSALECGSERISFYKLTDIKQFSSYVTTAYILADETVNSDCLTWSSMCLSWAAERQKRARDSMMGVAGKPTTTTAIPRFRHSRLNALQFNNSSTGYSHFAILRS